jgi:hypothetical protein
VWYVSITYMVLGEVGDEITMEKHQSKKLAEEIERVKTIRIKEGASLRWFISYTDNPNYFPTLFIPLLC